MPYQWLITDIPLDPNNHVLIKKSWEFSGTDKNVMFVPMPTVIVIPTLDVIPVLMDFLFTLLLKTTIPEQNVINVPIMLNLVVSTESEPIINSLQVKLMNTSLTFT